LNSEPGDTVLLAARSNGAPRNHAPYQKTAPQPPVPSKRRRPDL
jgi:hypothetical protein